MAKQCLLMEVTAEELAKIDGFKTQCGFASRGEFMESLIGWFNKLTAEIEAGKRLVLRKQDGTTLELVLIL